jgi:hypothetical protein
MRLPVRVHLLASGRVREAADCANGLALFATQGIVPSDGRHDVITLECVAPRRPEAHAERGRRSQGNATYPRLFWHQSSVYSRVTSISDYDCSNQFVDRRQAETASRRKSTF